MRTPIEGCTTTVARTAITTIMPIAGTSKPKNVARTSSVPRTQSPVTDQRMLGAATRASRAPATFGKAATPITGSDQAFEERGHVALAPIEEHPEHLRPRALQLPLRALHLVDAGAIGLDHEHRRVDARAEDLRVRIDVHGRRVEDDELETL